MSDLATIAGLSPDRPRIMGILNVTPDSFSDGGAYFDVNDAVAQARLMIADGADILDIGGESTRPGATEVSVAEETARVIPVIHALRDAGLSTPISIDTSKAPVAHQALAAGANIVNDVSAMEFDTDMADVVATSGAPICLMHSQGRPDTLQNDPRYGDVVAEVRDYLAARIEVAVAAGIARSKIITDPGIGFGKRLEHNITLLQNLHQFHDLGCPILLGASRKKFIGTLTDAPNAADRMPGSVAVALWGVTQGVQILRVHDTKATKAAVQMQRALMKNE